MVREPELTSRGRGPLQREGRVTERDRNGRFTPCRGGAKSPEEVAATKEGAEDDRGRAGQEEQGRRGEGAGRRSSRAATVVQQRTQGCRGSRRQRSAEQRMSMSACRNWVASRGAAMVGSQQGSVEWGGQLPQTSTKWASGGGSQAEACRRDPRWQAYSAEVTLRERGGKPFVTWTQFTERMAGMEEYKLGESVDSAQERHAPASPPAAAQTAFFAAAYANGAVRTPSPPACWTTAAWGGMRERSPTGKRRVWWLVGGRPGTRHTGGSNSSSNSKVYYYCYYCLRPTKNPE